MCDLFSKTEMRQREPTQMRLSGTDRLIKIFWSIKSLDESVVVHRKFDWTRFFLSRKTKMENLELFEAGHWNLPGRRLESYDSPISCSKIGEVKRSYTELEDDERSEFTFRLFKKPKIWTTQLEKLKFL